MDKKRGDLSPFGPLARDEWRLIAHLAWPVIVEQILVIFVTVVSTVFTGAIDASSIAAVGMVNMIIGQVQAAVAMLATGSVVLVARLIGEHDRSGANAVTEQALSMTLVAAAAISALCFLLATPLLRALMPTADVSLFGATHVYLRIIALSFPGLMLNTVSGGILRGAGDTRTPMAITLMCNALNLILNYLAIFHLHAGLYGMGWATMIARTAGGLAMLWALLHAKNRLSIDWRGMFAIRRGVIARILRVGFPTTIEQSVVQAGYLLLQSQVVLLGTAAATAYQVTSSINSISGILNAVLQTVATTLVGQHLGAREYAKARLSCRQSLLLGCCFSTAMAVLVALTGGTFASLYTDNPEVIALCKQALWIMVLADAPALVINVTIGTLRAAGDMRFTMYVSVLGVWLVRAPLVYLFCFVNGWSVVGAYLAILGDYLVRSAAYLIRVARGRWQYIRI